MQKVIDNSAVPPGGYHVYVETDGHTLRHPYFNVLKNQVKAYRQANNYPIGLNFDEEFEDNICAHAKAGVCFDFVPPSLLEKAGHLINALGKAARNGFKVVSATELERRLQICSQCNWFGGQRGVFKVMCKHCGCSGLRAHLDSSTCSLPPAERKW